MIKNIFTSSKYVPSASSGNVLVLGHSASCKKSTGVFPVGIGQPEHRTSNFTFFLCRDSMWTLASKFPVDPHGLWCSYLYLYQANKQIVI